MIGVGENQSNVYIIDFGRSKKYRNAKTYKHIAYQEGLCYSGTSIYLTLNNSLGISINHKLQLIF